MSDTVVVGSLVLSCAVFGATHVSIAWGLGSRAPRWRAAVAFLVPPLAVYWAFREKMSVRAFVVCGAVAVYVIARALASY
jgi:hypothetical protein